MKKTFSVLLCVLITASVLFAGCAKEETETDATVTDTASQSVSTDSSVSVTDSSTTIAETSTSASTTAKQTTVKATEKQTTTKAATTTVKQTTAKATTKATTQITTTAATTTTTTSAHCTNNNNHSVACGNIGKWLSDKSEVKSYVSSVMQGWNQKYENGEITWDEYTKNCPSGYECWSCGYCGKWTGNFTY